MLLLFPSDVALSLNDTEVKLFKRQGPKWTETGSLTEHGQRVTGIDWAPKSNRIVTCGAVSSLITLKFLNFGLPEISVVIYLKFR